MTIRPPFNWPALASAFIALLLAVIGGYLSLDRRVNANAATALTAEQVEHIVELKTSDKLDEIIRRLQHIDTQIDRLEQSGRQRNHE